MIAKLGRYMLQYNDSAHSSYPIPSPLIQCQLCRLAQQSGESDDWLEATAYQPMRIRIPSPGGNAGVSV